MDLHMHRRIRRARANDLAILDDATDVDDRGPIRGRGGVLHHDGRKRRGLEIRKRPFGGRMVGFHALQGVDENPSAFEINGAFFGDDVAFDVAAGPEGVSHCPPWMVRIGAEVGFTVGADLEARSDAGDGEVDDAGFVDGGFDGVSGGVVVEGDGAAVGVERKFAGVEAVVVESVGGPEVGCFVAVTTVGVEDFGVELAGCPDTAEGTISAFC